AGMDDYLSKPIQSQAVLSVLRKFCFHREASARPSPADPAPAGPSPADPAPAGPTPGSGKNGDESLMVLNPGQLLDISDADEETIHELISEFLKDAPPYLDDLKEAVASGNREKIFQAAHRLKGMVANAGGEMVREMLSDVENDARRGEDDSVRVDVALLENGLDRLTRMLKKTDWAALCK
ncbi:MAG: hypothetical protein GY859_16655, partial [Desulfobacterales bacterium]|nr:hypothetical protein [Desulfobacterales bacterium]